MQKSTVSKILITGATGNFGTEITKLLAAQKVPFRAMVRSKKGADELTAQIEFVDISPEIMQETLIRFGIPEWQADGLIEDYAHYSRGEASVLASGVQDATGKLPRFFDDFARDYAPAFS